MAGPVSFSHSAPAFRLHAGADSLQQLPAELGRLGCRRAAIFCGRTLSQRAELQLAIEALGDRHAGTFAGVRAHSPLPEVLAGAAALRDMKADAVVALGGGSAVVSARAATILLAEGPDIHALCTQYPAGKAPVSPKLTQPKLPQFVLATTPSTAYAKAGAAVLDTAQGKRLALFDPGTRARAVFLHPALALGAPPPLVLDAGLQALCSAVQGLESRSRNPLADAMLMHALRLLVRHLPQATTDRDGGARIQLMLAAFLAGQGTDYAPLGLNAALAHALGARCHTSNGLTGALLLPHTLRFNAPATGERLALAAEAMGAHATAIQASAAEAAIAALKLLLLALGLPSRLEELGVDKAVLPQVAQDALGDWFLRQNPRRVTDAATLEEMLEAAW